MKSIKRRKRMRIKNKIQHLVLAISLIIISISCVSRTESADTKKRQIEVYSQCSSEEASADILYSVNEIKEQLTEKGIVINADDKKKLCGYLLVNGTKTKKITGALTDIELLQEVNKFFK